jgi:hypothetical protein
LVFTIHQLCDGGEGRIRTVNTDIQLAIAGFHTSQQTFHATNRVYETYTN